MSHTAAGKSHKEAAKLCQTGYLSHSSGARHTPTLFTNDQVAKLEIWHKQGWISSLCSLFIAGVVFQKHRGDLRVSQIVPSFRKKTCHLVLLLFPTAHCDKPELLSPVGSMRWAASSCTRGQNAKTQDSADICFCCLVWRSSSLFAS